ncbi:MAG: glycosyltransferase family 4 protein [Pseudomonadota bacterium]
MTALARKFVTHSRRHGFRSALGRTISYCQGTAEAQVNTEIHRNDRPQKIDIIDRYEMILGHLHGDTQDLKRLDIETPRIQWVIPNFGFGSGGHLNIFRFINLLSDMGYDQHLVIVPPHNWTNADKAREAINKWYFPVRASIGLGVDHFKPAQATIATGWQTAYWVHHHQASRTKFYFVQDHEPDFSPQSSDSTLAAETYRLGLTGITAGTWLKDKLAQDYQMKTYDVSFACDTEFYQPIKKQPKPNFDVLFYSRHSTPRRLFEIGLLALNQFAQNCDNLGVIFAGGDVSRFEIPFHHLNAGELQLSQLPDLYSQCDLALVLSATNLSLLPLELAACKCPLVLNDTPSANWLLPRSAAYYAKPTPDGLAKALSRAYENPNQRAKKADEAYRIARARSWKTEAEKIVKIIEGSK